MRQAILPGWTYEVAEQAVAQYEAALEYLAHKDEVRLVGLAAEQLTDRLADSWSKMRMSTETADVMSYIYDTVLTKSQGDQRAYARAKGVMERAREQAYAYRAAAGAEALEAGAGSLQAAAFNRLDQYIREVEHAADSSARPNTDASAPGEAGCPLFPRGDGVPGSASETDGVHPVVDQ